MFPVSSAAAAAAMASNFGVVNSHLLPVVDSVISPGAAGYALAAAVRVDPGVHHGDYLDLVQSYNVATSLLDPQPVVVPMGEDKGPEVRALLMDLLRRAMEYRGDDMAMPYKLGYLITFVQDQSNPDPGQPLASAGAGAIADPTVRVPTAAQEQAALEARAQLATMDAAMLGLQVAMAPTELPPPDVFTSMMEAKTAEMNANDAAAAAAAAGATAQSSSRPSWDADTYSDELASVQMIDDGVFELMRQRNDAAAAAAAAATALGGGSQPSFLPPTPFGGGAVPMPVDTAVDTSINFGTELDIRSREEEEEEEEKKKKKKKQEENDKAAAAAAATAAAAAAAAAAITLRLETSETRRVIAERQAAAAAAEREAAMLALRDVERQAAARDHARQTALVEVQQQMREVLVGLDAKQAATQEELDAVREQTASAIRRADSNARRLGLEADARKQAEDARAAAIERTRMLEQKLADLEAKQAQSVVMAIGLQTDAAASAQAMEARLARQAHEAEEAAKQAAKQAEMKAQIAAAEAATAAALLHAAQSKAASVAAEKRTVEKERDAAEAEIVKAAADKLARDVAKAAADKLARDVAKADTRARDIKVIIDQIYTVTSPYPYLRGFGMDHKLRNFDAFQPGGELANKKGLAKLKSRFERARRLVDNVHSRVPHLDTALLFSTPERQNIKNLYTAAADLPVDAPMATVDARVAKLKAAVDQQIGHIVHTVVLAREGQLDHPHVSRALRTRLVELAVLYMQSLASLTDPGMNDEMMEVVAAESIVLRREFKASADADAAKQLQQQQAAAAAAAAAAVPAVVVPAVAPAAPAKPQKNKRPETKEEDEEDRPIRSREEGDEKGGKKSRLAGRAGHKSKTICSNCGSRGASMPASCGCKRVFYCDQACSRLDLSHTCA